MSCHGCAEKFGFLKKEYGCPKCKFSYCKKCLRFQAVDPTSSKQINTCFKCSQGVTSPNENIAIRSALHRLESMDDPAKPPITVYHQPTRVTRLQELKRGLSEQDQAILERLESLKKDDSIHTGSGRRRSSGKPEDEIAERLARLKDEEYNPEAKSGISLLRNVKPETDEDIIAKYSAEVEMDSRYDASVVSDIEERLARLRGNSGGRAEEGTSDSSTKEKSKPAFGFQEEDELSEEDQVKLIMQKLQEELAIEERVGPTSEGSAMDVDTSENAQTTRTDQSVSDEDDIDVDDLCGICSDKRATLQCEECDGDIFCKGCFQELHQELGEIHKAKLIKKK